MKPKLSLICIFSVMLSIIAPASLFALECFRVTDYSGKEDAVKELGTNIGVYEKYNLPIHIIRSSNSNVLFYELAEGKYCPMSADFACQIRLLDQCPDGVERDFGCIEIIPLSPSIDLIEIENGICTAPFVVYSSGLASYSDELESRTLSFPCGDLDKLEAQGKIPKGKTIFRNFQATPWHKLYPNMQTNYDIYKINRR